TLFAACELGVFDFLLASERPMSAAQVAAGLGTDVDGMERLLSACAGLELLGTQAAGGEVLYSNTDMSRMYLSRSSPRSLFHSVEYYSKTVYLCWNYLTDAVREGKNQYEKAFGLPSEDLFEALYRSDDEMIKFMQLMNSTWNVCGRDVMTAFDLSPFKTIYDLGEAHMNIGFLPQSIKPCPSISGCTSCPCRIPWIWFLLSAGCSGALAKQCVRAYPQSSVTIFDLPKVVSTCREHFVSPTDERIFFHEGDFFKDLLPEADLYILARILHDWTDECCVELLSRVHQSCKPGGGVLLVEALLNEDNSGPLTAQLYSLNMLVQTEGRERKASEYSALLTTAGFANVEVQRTGKIYDAILARKDHTAAHWDPYDRASGLWHKNLYDVSMSAPSHAPGSLPPFNVTAALLFNTCIVLPGLTNDGGTDQLSASGSPPGTHSTVYIHYEP
ncbi:acetylserotonin O-methyltransferase-like, partial [Scleropages formosus]